MNEHYPFELQPLKYPYNALEPYIDEKTVRIHHNKHLGKYVDNLNATLEGYPQFHTWSLEHLIVSVNKLPECIRRPILNNAGGVYNHDFYFDIMAEPHNTLPSEGLGRALVTSFGCFEDFKEEFKRVAMDRFGSGYAWLFVDKRGRLRITSTANQDTLLPYNVYPLLLIDVWEHAYYLKYQNLRDAYIENWFHVIDWNVINRRYDDMRHKESF